MLDAARRVFSVNPYPEHSEVAAVVRGKLGAATDAAAKAAVGYEKYVHLIKEASSRLATPFP